MKSISIRVFAAATLISSFAGAATAEAGCHGRSGGYSTGYSYRHSSYHRPVYQYAQPTFSPTLQTQLPPTVVRQTQLVQPGFVNQQGVLNQPGEMLNQPGSLAQPSAVSGPQTGVNGQFGEVGAGSASVAPGNTTGNIRVAAGNNSQPAAGQTTAPQTGSGSAELSALQALGGFAPPQTSVPKSESPGSTVQPTPQPPVHVGSWTARLTNGASVQLLLKSDGSFNWSATNKAGSTSTFQGSYSVQNGQLTLVRSSDNQKLSGAMNANGSDAFSFRLADTGAPAIDFSRG